MSTQKGFPMKSTEWAKAKKVLTLEGAKMIMEGAKKKAEGLGIDMDVAIVDNASCLIAFERMNNVKITGI